jgi:hypothetical protein
LNFRRQTWLAGEVRARGEWWREWEREVWTKREGGREEGSAYLGLLERFSACLRFGFRLEGFGKRSRGRGGGGGREGSEGGREGREGGREGKRWVYRSHQ